MGIRQRQERYLQRELQRIDDYYDAYERELLERRRRSDRDTVHLRVAERLAAATADRERRRQDQLHRHEIRIIPHWDALLLLAEPAWSAVVSAIEGHDRRVDQARFVPRLRWWLRCADVV